MIDLQNYTHADYEAVRQFLIRLGDQHINWNWARWEWMYQHPYLDREKLNAIGLWKADGEVVGVAIYDLFLGEAFCAAQDNALLPEIVDYAWRSLKDENGLGIAARDEDAGILTALGFAKAEQRETVMCTSLEKPLVYALPEGYRVREIHFPEDNMAYQTVIWKGFDHEGDQAELEKMLRNKALPPNRKPFLCLGVEDTSGEFAAHCTCWYDERTDYAYVEPVCTVPAHRGKGLGTAVVTEALNRCHTLGAARAFVLSDQDFYKRLGFKPYAHYAFYWRRES